MEYHIVSFHRCETRPGPQYMVRKYVFYNNSHFDAHQYFYHDNYCTKARYAVEARGTFRRIQGSWTLPGATEVDYDLSHVSVIPYDPKMAIKLMLRVNRTCPSKMGKNQHLWRPYERYEVMKYIADKQDGKERVILDRDCTNAIKFNLHELQLMRMEVRSHHGSEKRELFLGGVHTDRSLQMEYRPTSYQEPLVQAGVRNTKIFRVT